MAELDVETIIQGGGIGVAVLLIFLLGWVIKIHNTTVNNHLDHLTKALGGLETYMSKNGKLLDRVERALDRLINGRK